MTELSAEQMSGIEEIGKWYEDAVEGFRGPFRLFGPAGTGKTTMAKAIPDALGVGAQFMAFTGKAAHVLQRKGITGARTIHSSIYYPTSDEEAKRELAELRTEVEALEETAAHLATLQHDEARAALVTGLGWASVMEFSGALDEGRERIGELESRSKRMAWELNPEAFAETNPGVLILDEVSMVNEKLATDLGSYGIPIVVLGDPAQLPPVEGGGYYINGPADYMLEEIHRQALESPVLSLATRIRLSQGPALGMTHGDTEPASIADAMAADQVIVWSNKRRWSMITVMRRKWGRPEGVPVEGDRVMCLANNRDLGIFNGQQFTVITSKDAAMGPTLTLLDDDGHTRSIPAYADGFQGLDVERMAKNSGSGIRGGRGLFTFGQAITCHKSQGSEWRSVYVVNEIPNMMAMDSRKQGPKAAEAKARQWLYTAVTRASERVTITTPNRNAR
jgi:Mesyanzhinovviridae Dda-like helicase